MSAMTSIELLSPADLVQSPAFSHVAIVPAGATQIYVGGQNAVDAAGQLVGGDDIVAQVERVMANLETALESAGASMADLISVTILLVEGTDLQAGYGGGGRPGGRQRATAPGHGGHRLRAGGAGAP